MEADLSTLKLVFEKGPRKDEALEFNSKPRLTVSIGRVVRGNKVTIKDNGISSKHLSIDWHGQGKWVVRDLDSSNGTFLNSIQLQPLTDYDLHDGDELKFGEVTSIRVRFSHVSDFQMDRKTRAEVRVLETENLDEDEKVAEEVNRRGRGKGRGTGGVGSRDGGVAMESTDALASVELEANIGGHMSRPARSRRRGNDDVGSGLVTSASVASVESEKNTESNAPEQGARRVRGLRKGESSKTSIMPLVTKEKSEITENVKGMGRRRTRTTKNVKDEAEVIDERPEKGDDEECKAESEVSLRRSTRRTKKKANPVLPPVLERIPEAPQSADSMSCEEVVNVPPTKKQNARTRQGRKKKELEVGLQSAQNVTVEEKGRRELNEGEGFSSESMDGVQKDGCLASDLVSEQEKSKDLDLAAVKSEPQSRVREIIPGGDQPRKEPTSDIVQNGENLVCELNHEGLDSNFNPDENREQRSKESTSAIVEKDENFVCELNREESEFNSDPDDKVEPQSNVRRNASQDPTADGHTTEKDAVPDIARDLEKMTLGEWFNYLEEFLPKQIRAETDQIIEDMRKRSQQFHEFMSQQQK